MPAKPNKPMRPKAYSYTKWSTPSQQDGDSLRRQTDLSQQYAAKLRTNCTLDEEKMERDDGK